MFAEKIKDFRTRNGLTQAGLAEILGCPKKTVQDWEQGRSQPKEWLQPIIIEKLEREEIKMKEMEITKKILARVGIEPTEENIEQLKKDGTLTVNTCRNGRDVVWYMSETTDIAMYSDTQEELTEEEKEEQLM